MEKNVTRSWTIQTKNAAARSRLTAPAFSYQSKRLILLYFKADIIYGFYVPDLAAQESFGDGEVHFEVFKLYDVVILRGFHCFS
jgi:hypothetical protein